ncbi:hypothetical protein [Phascolarctobacterium succinatutens]|uniref:hypothetical protein n=1 Tax=Phascolarctobacterium succinatutens TaxID=626940 RepID=UPI003A90BE55
MSKNLIPQIAQMLGVEIGEKFQIKEYGERIYRFANSGLQLIYDNGVRNLNTTTNMALSGLLSGEFEIVKLPWKPKKGDVYYTFELLWGKWVVRSLWWAGVPCNYALLDKGWVFRTKEEAKAALPKVAAEMGVGYEL